MKKIILIALMALPAIVSAQKNQFILKGTVENMGSPAMAYLNYRLAGENITDSINVINGHFQFQGKIDAPLRALLIVDHIANGLRKAEKSNDRLNLYLEKGEIIISSQDSVKKGIISGSVTNAENLAYINGLSAPGKKIATINQEYAAASADKKKDAEFNKYLQAKFGEALKEREELQYEYIKKNPGSFISLDVLTEIAGPGVDIVKVEPLFQAMSTDIKNSEGGIALSKAIEDARVTAVGAMAPLFTQNDVNEKPVNLTDFKGKYVLLDFWASWCHPCRAENPNVVKAYNAYKNKGFTVLGVSLDQPGKKDAWLAAIKADGLEWTQVSDLKFWKNEVAKKYNIHSIPQNFLIDPTGKIIAINLRGEELQQKLAEVLGK